MNKHTTMVEKVELMAASVGAVGGETCLILTMRLNPKKFESHNIALTADQAVRLRRDLKHIFNTSQSMKKSVKKHLDSQSSFDKIISG